MWILGMIGEIRQGRGEGSWAGKPGGFTGLFRFISKDANEPQERCICIDPLLQDSTVSAFFLQRGHDSNLFLCYKHWFFFLCLFLSFVGGEGSAETGQKETSTCDICQFGAECDVDAEDVWWVKTSSFFSSSEPVFPAPEEEKYGIWVFTLSLNKRSVHHLSIKRI